MGTKTPEYISQLKNPKTGEKRIPKHGDENSMGTTINAVVTFPVKKESPNMGTKTAGPYHSYRL